VASRVLNGVRKSFGTTPVLDDVSLTLEQREFIAFLGPSGSGKSTLLRIIAGLESADAGEVWLEGRRIDQLPPGDRRIAMVFQHYALYPHMSTRENMAFGLRNARVARDEIDRRIADAARVLEIEPLLDRKPAEMSGGQRQRVAIGRAIVREPDVFLFDEPLSNLDASLRNRMRFEFAALHKTLGTTTVYVTHDQVEAMTLADRIVVMREGVIEQIGSPAELYERPVNRFVAGFLGSPQMNFLSGQVVEDSGDGQALQLASGERIALPPSATAVGAPLTIGVRPEHWRAGPDQGLKLRADFIERLGSSVNIHLERAAPGAGEEGVPSVIWHHVEPARVSEGELVHLAPDPAHIHLFDAGGQSIARA
jgi:multiple sugar transport system ATP-binding protein